MEGVGAFQVVCAVPPSDRKLPFRMVSEALHHPLHGGSKPVILQVTAKL